MTHSGAEQSPSEKRKSPVFLKKRELKLCYCISDQSTINSLI